MPVTLDVCEPSLRRALLKRMLKIAYAVADAHAEPNPATYTDKTLRESAALLAIHWAEEDLVRPVDSSDSAVFDLLNVVVHAAKHLYGPEPVQPGAWAPSELERNCMFLAVIKQTLECQSWQSKMFVTGDGGNDDDDDDDDDEDNDSDENEEEEEEESDSDESSSEEEEEEEEEDDAREPKRPRAQ